MLSVDIPSGVDGSTGKLASLGEYDDEDEDEEGAQIYVKANWVVCMGAPKAGLLGALTEGTWSLSQV